MTAYFLLQALAKYLEELTGEMRLRARAERNTEQKAITKPNIYRGKLPDKRRDTLLAPYILLKLLTGKDDEKEREGKDSICHIRIVIVTYEEDAEENYMQCLNVLEKIRFGLMEERVIDNRYTLQMPLEYIMYEDDTGEYQIGELMTIWEMPPINRKID